MLCTVCMFMPASAIYSSEQTNVVNTITVLTLQRKKLRHMKDSLSKVAVGAPRYVVPQRTVSNATQLCSSLYSKMTPVDVGLVSQKEPCKNP